MPSNKQVKGVHLFHTLPLGSFLVLHVSYFPSGSSPLRLPLHPAPKDSPGLWKAEEWDSSRGWPIST